VLVTTRDVEAFLKKTAIAYHQIWPFWLDFRGYAIAVFFKNASTSRVLLHLTTLHNGHQCGIPYHHIIIQVILL